MGSISLITQILTLLSDEGAADLLPRAILSLPINPNPPEAFGATNFGQNSPKTPRCPLPSRPHHRAPPAARRRRGRGRCGAAGPGCGCCWEPGGRRGAGEPRPAAGPPWWGRAGAGRCGAAPPSRGLSSLCGCGCGAAPAGAVLLVEWLRG